MTGRQGREEEAAACVCACVCERAGSIAYVRMCLDPRERGREREGERSTRTEREGRYRHKPHRHSGHRRETVELKDKREMYTGGIERAVERRERERERLRTVLDDGNVHWGRACGSAHGVRLCLLGVVLRHCARFFFF